MSDAVTTIRSEEAMELASRIVSAYVSNNHVQPTELPGLLTGIHRTLLGLDGTAAPVAEDTRPRTAAEIRKSITNEHLISFEDGKSYKTLGRHLKTRDLTPESYRAKWGLPADYPMTSPGYSAKRSELAKALGLGQQRRSDDTPAASSEPEAEREAA